MSLSPWFSCWSSHRPASGSQLKTAGRKRPSPGLALEILEERMAPAVYTVNRVGDVGTGTGNSGDIRYVVNQINTSPGATDTVNFAANLANSTIFLTHGQLAFDANNEHVTINGLGASSLAINGSSAGQASRVFDFDSSNGTFAVNNLKITGGNGSSTYSATPGDQSGNIQIDAGGVTLTGDVVSNGKVVGIPVGAGANGDLADGGGIFVYSGASLILNSTQVTGNVAQGGNGGAGSSPGGNGGNGGSAQGGGVYCSGSLVVTNHSLFQNNQALGGAGGSGADGAVGEAGSNNGNGGSGGTGGNGGVGGFAQGGGIYFQASATLAISASTFTSNTAKSGVGGQSGNGGAGGAGNGTGNGGAGGNAGTGGNGSSAWGGGVAAIGVSMSTAPAMMVTGSTFTSNQAITDSPGSGGNGGAGGAGGSTGSGGAGGNGGTGGLVPQNDSNGAITAAGSWGGAIGMEYGNELTINSSVFTSNSSIVNTASNGGAGGQGGHAGTSNSDTGGAGGNGGGAFGAGVGPSGNTGESPQAWGGAIAAGDSDNLNIGTTAGCSFTGNQATGSKGGNGGAGGQGGAGYTAGLGGGSGGEGGVGGTTTSSWGGAVSLEVRTNFAGNLTLNNSTFKNNVATSGTGGLGGVGGNGVDGGNGGGGGEGGSGAEGWGGGVSSETQTGADTITGSPFTSNAALSSSGGVGGQGGNGTNGGAGGAGGTGESSWGGAVFENGFITTGNTKETFTITSSPISGNRSISGVGAQGGNGGNGSSSGTGGAGGTGGDGNSAWGGGIQFSSSGLATVNNSSISNNLAQTGGSGRGGNGGNGGTGGEGGAGGSQSGVFGGGVMSDTPSLILNSSPVTGNRAIGGITGAGGTGGIGSTGVGGAGGDGSRDHTSYGGGISANLGGSNSLTLNASNVTGNILIESPGGAGGAGGAGFTGGGAGGMGSAAGSAYGGGIGGNSSLGISITNSKINNNQVTGGSGGAGGAGGNVTGSTGTTGSGGTGGAAGLTEGGGVGAANSPASSTFVFTMSDASDDVVKAGTGGAGGAHGTGGNANGMAGASGALSSSLGGGIYTDATTVTIHGGMLMMDTATGPTGVLGGGGGVALEGNTTVTIENNSIISCNTANGTAGGGGGLITGISTTVTISNSAMNRNVASNGNGGGIHLGAGTTATLTDLTVECNSALQGGGIASDGTGANTTTMGGSLVVGNLANPGPDLLGAFNTAGNNTIGEAGGFTGITNGVDGDRVGTEAHPIPVLVQPPYCGTQPTPPAPSRLGRR